MTEKVKASAVLDAKEMASRLSWSKRLIGKQVVKVLESAMFEWVGDRLDAVVTDTDVWARYEVPVVEHDGDGTAVVRVADMIAAIGKPKKGETATLQLWGGGEVGDRVELRAGVVKSEPSAYEPDDYPTRLRVDETWQLPMRGSHFAQMLGAVLPCVSKEKDRFQLTSVAVTSRDGELRFVSTDGHRMAIASVAGYGKALGRGKVPKITLMRSEMANRALDWPARNGEDVVVGGDDDGNLSLRMTACRMFSREFAGTFPQYERIEDMIGRRATMRLRTDKLADVCTAAVRLSGSGDPATVAIEVYAEGGEPTASFQTVGAGLREPIALEATWREGEEPESIRVGLNPRYVLDALKAAEKAESVTVELGSADRAVRFSWVIPNESGDVKMQHIIMPCRL